MAIFSLATLVHEKLAKAGIPVFGVSHNSKEEPHITLQWEVVGEEHGKTFISVPDTSTDEQKKQAQEIVDECLKNCDQYKKEWEEKQAEISKYGSEKNLQMAKMLVENGILKQEQVDKYFA